jgi:hypothetical protein
MYGGITEHVTVVGAETSRRPYPEWLAIHFEQPVTRGFEVGIVETLVVNKVLRNPRLAMTSEIPRRGADKLPEAAKTTRDQC